MKNMSELNQWNQCKDKKDNNVIGRLIAAILLFGIIVFIIYLKWLEADTGESVKIIERLTNAETMITPEKTVFISGKIQIDNENVKLLQNPITNDSCVGLYIHIGAYRYTENKKGAITQPVADYYKLLPFKIISDIGKFEIDNTIETFYFNPPYSSNLVSQSNLPSWISQIPHTLPVNKQDFSYSIIVDAIRADDIISILAVAAGGNKLKATEKGYYFFSGGRAEVLKKYYEDTKDYFMYRNIFYITFCVYIIFTIFSVVLIIKKLLASAQIV
ncbi:MAG TPA: hypothetical protein PLM75_11990 [bacterium]|nr:hypothetical protein [bacterium]